MPWKNLGVEIALESTGFFTSRSKDGKPGYDSHIAAGARKVILSAPAKDKPDMTVVMGGTPLGSPVIGWIGENLGARWTLVIGGVMVLIGVALALLVFRLASRRKAVEAPEPEIGVAAAA